MTAVRTVNDRRRQMIASYVFGTMAVVAAIGIAVAVQRARLAARESSCIGHVFKTLFQNRS
jgi:hypothetical protein